MAAKHDYVALGWVSSEIDATLKDALAMLEEYAENPADTSRLRFCVNHLHQVRGTLQMVEFYGAASLAEEMEKLASALMTDRVASRDEAIKVLMDGMLHLPAYLEKVRRGRRELPLRLLPMLNDLRAARGESLLTNNAFFNPDLRAFTDAPVPEAGKLPSPAQLKRQRQMFQFGLVGLLRNRDLEQNAEHMLKALSALRSSAGATAWASFWQAGMALVEATSTGAVELSLAVKSLLRALDSELRRIIEEGETGYRTRPSESLFRHLLYYAAVANAGTPNLKSLREKFALDNAVPVEEDADSEGADGADAATLSSVAAILAEELNRVKDQIDLFTRSDTRDASDLEALPTTLEQIANTLTVLGLGEARQSTSALKREIEAMMAGESATDDARLIELANQLLHVENLLAAGIGGGTGRSSMLQEASEGISSEQLRAAHDAVLLEARNSIEQAKLAITECIGSQWDTSHLQPVPGLLQAVAGNLQIIPLAEPAALLRRCARHVQDQLLASGITPDIRELDRLADAISSLEYFLERLAENGEHNDALLTTAEASVSALENPEASVLTPASPIATPPAAETPDAASVPAVDEDLIDEDIRDIFVEESHEVLETLRQRLPEWESDSENRVALADLRRAFHTLKGSGRLVGASEIGELAWSLEDLLNRVLEGSVAPSLPVHEVLGRAVELIPSMIAAYANRTEVPDAEPIRDEALRLVSLRQSTHRSESPAAAGAPDVAAEPATALQDSGASETGSAVTSSAIPSRTDSAPEGIETDHDDSLIDDEILEIFVEEAGEVLETIQSCLPRIFRNAEDRDALTETRRAFHTLKGSGRMVEAPSISELAWSVENLLNRVLEGQLSLTPEICELIRSAASILPELVSDFERRHPARYGTEGLQQFAHDVAAGRLDPDTTPPSPEIVESAPITATLDHSEAADPELRPELEAAEDAEDAETEVDPAMAERLETPSAENAIKADSEPADEVDRDLLPIFSREALSHLDTVDKVINVARSNDEPALVSDGLVRALHTLKGCANTAGMQDLADLAVPADALFKLVQQQQAVLDPALIDLLERMTSLMRPVLQLPDATRQLDQEEKRDWLQREAALRTQYLENEGAASTGEQADRLLLDIFLQEGIDSLLDADTLLEEWAQEKLSPAKRHQLVTELQTLSQGAEMARLDALAGLSEVLGLAWRRIRDGQTGPHSTLLESLRHGHHRLIDMLDQLAAGLSTGPADSEIKRIHAALDHAETVSEHRSVMPDAIDTAAAEPQDSEEGELASPLAAFGSLDPEILEIFIEEAEELVESSAAALDRLEEDPESTGLFAELQRQMHTIKGGARMAAIASLAELARQMENLFEALAEGLVTPSGAGGDGLQEPAYLPLARRGHTSIREMVENLQAQTMPVARPELEQEIASFIRTAGQLARAGELESVDTDSEEFEITDAEHGAVSYDEAGPSLSELAEQELDQDFEVEREPALAIGLPDEQVQLSELELELEPEPEAAPEAEAEVAPAYEAEPAFDAEPEPAPEAEAEIASAYEAEPEFEAEPEPAPEAEAEIASAYEAEPAFEAEPEPVPEAEAEAEVALEHEAESEAAASPPLAAGPAVLDLEDTEAPKQRGDLSAGDGIAVESFDEFVARLDPETVEIFLEEAEEILQRTSETLSEWLRDPSDHQVLAALQRDLHTLKGGARLAEIRAIGDLAHEMETLFERLTEGHVRHQPAMDDLLLQSHDRLATMVESIQNAQTPRPATDLVDALHKAAALGAGRGGASASAAAASISLSPGSPSSPNLKRPPVDTLAESDEAGIWDKPLGVPGGRQPASAEDTIDLSANDPELLELFLAEAKELTDQTTQLLQTWQDHADNADALQGLLRALHTLKGGARLAEVGPIGDLAHAFETLLERETELDGAEREAMFEVATEANDRLVEMIEQATDQNSVQTAADLIQRLQGHGRADAGHDSHTAYGSLHQETAGERPLLELKDGLESLSGHFDQWQFGTPGALRLLTLHSEKLARVARAAALQSTAELLEALAATLHGVPAEATQAGERPALTERTLATLRRQIEQLERGEAADAADDLKTQLQQAATTGGPAVELSGLDPEILEIFVEESRGQLASIRTSWGRWEKEPEHVEHGDLIQRQLHTLKGGARLANLPGIARDAQALEEAIHAAVSRRQALAGELKEELSRLLGQLAQQLEAVFDAARAIREGDRITSKPLTGAQVGKVGDPGIPQPRPTPADVRKERDPEQKDAAGSRARKQTGDTIRVPAQLLDELVNLAGETSITRGLMEQQISDFAHTLNELQATTDRLREQLRRMDIETEAQVLFRMEQQTGPQYEDFDPLEMDRYSSIQQLSRAMNESASDLTDLRETMNQRLRGTETLLLQQARVNTELQEGLMQTRLVPFNSIVPRLRRIVRQIGGELGKEAGFDVYNPEGELDRTVLDRMVAPLEHMLRNAMDHGIESPEKRRERGKPAAGTVSLAVRREGGDVIIELRDDGGGIDVEVIRKKAIKLGLLRPTEEIGKQEILQFIFHAGFSTAEKVTQISGRGVGMDVVASEIKKLGGVVSIDSEVGRGTKFTIRLPFTVSVNRALMVSTGEDYYAIPLNTIEGIVRVNQYELEEYYQPNAPLYEYAGKQYQVQYLGNLLDSGHFPKLQGQPLPLPVILVRGSDRPLALQVDQLLGSREIVVKTLGRQFSDVRGVSGATILGDGSVVVILDLPAMMREESDRLTGLRDAIPQERERTGPATVMVVDDSVTVRKVTSRLLERQGMLVITAKDGVDAIALLQDHRPDVMLLDIEMPRMDGFEVAGIVRHDDRLKDVPIIMITSRTGQKHRDRALSLGVNEYMGKPFQETLLLETIEKLIGARG